MPTSRSNDADFLECFPSYNNDKGNGRLGFFNIIPAFLAGLQDGFNPSALGAAIIFVFFIFAFAKNRVSILRFGTSFIIAVFLTTFLSHLGVFDVQFGSIEFQIILRKVQLVIAAVFIVLGIIHLYDWALLKRGRSRESFIIKMPELLTDKQKAEKSGFKIMLLGSILGFVVSVLILVWPPHFIISSLFLYLHTQGYRFVTFMSFGFYCIAFIIPLCFALFFIINMISSDKMFSFMNRSMSKIKIIIAGFLIAFGIGLIKIFI